MNLSKLKKLNKFLQELNDESEETSYKDSEEYKEIRASLKEAYSNAAKLTKLATEIGKEDWSLDSPAHKMFADEKQKDLTTLLDKILLIAGDLEIKASLYCAEHLDHAVDIQTEIIKALNAIFGAIHFANMIAYKVSATVLTNVLSNLNKVQKEDRSVPAFGFAGAAKGKAN